MPAHFFTRFWKELISINRRSVSIQTLVRQLLEEFGFELAWEEAVTGMVQNILSTPLDLANPDLVLSRISAHERLNEMEFNMPLDLLTSGKLRFILKSSLGNTVSENDMRESWKN